MSNAKFAMQVPVYDTFADDTEAFQAYVADCVPADWRDACERAGGRPIGEPRVEQIPNLFYGRALTNEDGSPLLSEDGEQIVDRVKLTLYVVGQAER